MKISSMSREYEVDFLDSIEGVFGRILDSDVVVTDQNVYQLYGERLGGEAIVVTAGEGSKSLEIYGGLVRELAKRRVNRGGRVVAFGGGVVGDLAGFVAATYMRGVDLVQVPTSLLAMVDSSVGGKVGIDLPEGKNLVGAFWPPVEVLICTRFLETLPEREFLNGMAEVWKYGWIMDEPFLNGLEASPPRPGDSGLNDLAKKCVEMKNAVVSGDEFETTGLRATLNFGHTIGHAIEKVLGYEVMLHGEAIAVGMVYETRLSERLGLCERGLSDRVSDGLARQGLPVVIPERIDFEQLIAAMYQDKKAEGDGLAFSLIEGPGRCKLVRGVSEGMVREVLGL